MVGEAGAILADDWIASKEHDSLLLLVSGLCVMRSIPGKPNICSSYSLKRETVGGGGGVGGVYVCIGVGVGVEVGGYYTCLGRDSSQVQKQSSSLDSRTDTGEKL